MAISEVVSRLIEGTGLNIKDVSQQIGVKYTTLYSIVSRKATRVDIHTLKAIADYFHEDLEIFLDEPNYQKHLELTPSEQSLIQKFRRLDTQAQSGVLDYMAKPPKTLSKEERVLLERFQGLNALGQGKALEEIGDLAEVPRYQR